MFFPKELSLESQRGEELLCDHILGYEYDPNVEKYIFIPIEGKRVEIANEEMSEPRRIAQALMKELEGMDRTERVATGLLVMGVDYHTAMENYFNNQTEKPPLVAALVRRLFEFRHFHGLEFSRISTKDLRVEKIIKNVDQ